MTDPGEPAPIPARRRARLRVLLVIAIVFAAILLTLWVERRPIATRFIDDELAARGVPATYGIADLGIGRQRLTDVVIGDPAAPDLVADWIETRVAVGLSGATLRGVRAGHVRVRGRLVDGKLSLGAIDKLMPPSSGKPFALPALDVDVADARMRLETPYGVVGLKLAGQGVLNDGFRGTIAVVAPELTVGGCTLATPQAAMRIAITRASPTLAGPIRFAAVACNGVTAAQPRADLTVTLSPALDRWRGEARLATARLAAPDAALASGAGTLTFAGTRAVTAGRADLGGTALATSAATARRVTMAGDYRLAREIAFTGHAAVGQAQLSPRLTAPVAALARNAAGSPIAPLAARLATAIAAAARDADAQADLSLRIAGGRGVARLATLSLASRSGARVALAGGSGVTIGLPGTAVRVDTTLTTSGGDLPAARIALAQAAPGLPIRGTARIAPYAAGDARLALTPVTFTATPGGATRIATTATLDGPIGSGRIEGATLALTAGISPRGTIVFNPRCETLSFDRLRVSGLDLQPARIPLCPTAAALVTVADGRASGGARLTATRLAGRLGSTPLTLAATGADLRLGDRGFTIRGVETRLGAPDRMTRLDFAELIGRIDRGVVAGSFAGGNGQIANVPLLLSNAAGDWTFARGALALTGAMTVSDAAATPRFNPLAARGVALSLKDNAIQATGTLYEPTTTTKVADVAIRHALGTGTGSADLTVPGIVFAENFQPDLLTRLTFGVIADVHGTLSGQGRIDWNADGVTSTGVFRTPGIDLAAAFGPVTGIVGGIAFDDLLGMRSAPDQRVAIRSINPGIEVKDGVVRFRVLSPTQVAVDNGNWPFAGGSLTLAPTLLDFSTQRERRMTFTVTRAAADQFLQQFDFSNVNATGIFDGTLPMIFDEKGGRIEGGTLTVRPGGGTLAYVGDLSQKDMGFWPNLAFQALRSLRYKSLGITMNGPLAGEMVTEVKFAGVSQGKGAKSNFLIRRLQKLPFVFNIRIKAPFRGLLDSAQSFYDPKRLIQRNLPTLLQRQQGVPPPASAPVPTPTPSIQPPASEIVP